MPHSANEPCELLEWDSRFFGFTVAKMRGDLLTDGLAAEVDSYCAAKGVSLLYFPARCDDVTTSRAAEAHGFYLTDVRMTLGRKIGQPASAPPGNVRMARSDDLVAMCAIAHGSYADTRFHYDDHIARQQADALYERWVVESCRGYADAVLAAEVGGQLAGYITCHLRDSGKHGSIGLVGVADAFRGQGVGRAVIDGAMHWFAGAGAGDVTVVTQARNVGAQRLYQRCGFVTEKIELYYHKWYGRAGR